MTEKQKITIKTKKKGKKDYQIIDSFIAGIVLNGDEVKSIRNKQIYLENSYIIKKDNAVLIIGLHISHYKKMSFFSNKSYDPIRKKQLLLKKTEIQKIFKKAKIKKCSIIPTKILLVGRWIKIEIALAKQLKKYQSKVIEKEKEIEKKERRKQQNE